MSQERQHRENDEHEEEDLRACSGVVRHSRKAEEGGDQSDDEKQDCQA
jgi:hypothetical protein